VADIDIRRAHALGVEGAREAADRMMATLAQRFGLHGAWDGNVLRFERPGVTGHLAIEPDKLHLAITLGFLMRAMRTSIEAQIKDELHKIFGSASKG